MGNTMLFVAGVLVTAVAFTGILIYAMLVFSNFAERTNRGTGELKSNDD